MKVGRSESRLEFVAYCLHPPSPKRLKGCLQGDCHSRGRSRQFLYHVGQLVQRNRGMKSILPWGKRIAADGGSNPANFEVVSFLTPLPPGVMRLCCCSISSCKVEPGLGGIGTLVLGDCTKCPWNKCGDIPEFSAALLFLVLKNNCGFPRGGGLACSFCPVCMFSRGPGMGLATP